MTDTNDNEKFCDSNCTWSDHHPDCKYLKQNDTAAGWRKRQIEQAQPATATPNTYGDTSFIDWFYSEPHREKYLPDHPAFLTAQEAWDALLAQRKPLTDEQIRKSWAQHAAKQNGWPNDATPPMIDIGNGPRFQAHWHESEYQVFKAGFKAAHGIKGNA